MSSLPIHRLSRKDSDKISPEDFSHGIFTTKDTEHEGHEDLKESFFYVSFAVEFF